MKKAMNVRIALLLALMMAFAGFAFAEAAEPEENTFFEQWNPDAPSLKALVEYVEAVTDPDSPDYIPPADRIATFDMDGTLCAELNPTYLEYYLLARRILADPSYQPDEEMLAFGRMLRDHALDRSFPDGMDMLHATHAARAYAGMTLTEFADFVTRQIVREADGFEGMTYAETFYLPMIEVVEYLQANDFKVYICSGSDRFICRTFIEGMLDIPYENIIGMDVQLEATHQGDADGLNYVFASNDTLVRTDKLLIKNLKTNKVLQIARDIGRQPVLSFGNSSGDVSMHNYTLFNNKYRSAAFQLIADNDVQDYGDPAKGPELRQKWEGMGFTVISMADDWKTIYGEGVVKTGVFHWLEDLAEDITPAAEVAEEAQADGNVQYVLYLGTNSKDTNKPVFTQAQAMEVAREILMRHFGGYTIQEAHGGWVGDDGTEYREYTLVIYLSDTTLDAVHAAADELVATFDQSSVLIQSTPTTTEFYSGAEAAPAADAQAPAAATDDAATEPGLLSEYWTEGSEAAASLNDYLRAVTDPASPDYIPVADRIAVFDLDGTLMCETYPFCFEYMLFADYALNSGSDTITDEVRAVAQEIVDAAGGVKPKDMSTRQASAAAVAYQGMTMGDLAAIVDAFKDSEAWGFSGMTRGEAFYKPMVELFDVLLKNDFTVYIVTATERNIVREVIKGTLDIPASHVIGTEYGYTATAQNGAADADYTFQPSDQIVFDGTYYGENAKTSKVDAIVREIGQQPVLAFGNSSGDLAMAVYTITNNPWRSAAYMVLADDEAREYGDAESAVKKRASYAEQGIGSISMREDFKTIYGDEVTKVEMLRANVG